MPRRFLAVCRRIDNLFPAFTLGRELNRVGVVEAGDHDVAVFLDGIFWVHVVVVKRVRCDPHLIVIARRLG